MQRDFAVEMVPLDSPDLRAHPRNYRDHQFNRAEIAESIEDDGIDRNVLISSDGYLIAGHGVVEAARFRGETHVPAVRKPYPHDDPRAIRRMLRENLLSDPNSPRGPRDDGVLLLELLRETEDTLGLRGMGQEEGLTAQALLELSEHEAEEAHETADSMRHLWLVAFVVSEDQKRALDAEIDKSALLGEKPSATLARITCERIVNKS